MKQPDLYYFETIKMTSQALSKFTENTRLRLEFSIQNLTRLVTSFLWFQNSLEYNIQVLTIETTGRKPSCIRVQITAVTSTFYFMLVLCVLYSKTLKR